MSTLSRASLLLLVGVCACGPSDRLYPDGANGSGSGSGSGSGNGSNQDGCSDAAKKVYVVDENNTFSSFDPMTKTFTDLGTLSCSDFLGSPFSMGVDRNAIAWVLYNDGSLFHVDTTQTNLPCTSTSFAQPMGLANFGMGFSSDTMGGTTDTLFIAGGGVSSTTSGTSKMATLNTSTMAATSVGTVTGWPELTGTGTAELWGWFPDASSPQIRKLDKSNGSAITTYPESSLAGMPMAWAFAFWGGDFWVFLEKGSESSTTVYQIDGMTGAIKGSTPTGSRTIVGAGVSTCAPTVIL